MPFFLVLIGMLMIVTGVRNTHLQAGSMVAADLTGSNDTSGHGFIWYAVAIGGVASLGAIAELRTLSHYLLALILIALVLNNRGVFQQFTAALKQLPAASVASPAAQTPAAAGAGFTPSTPLTPSQGVQQGAGGVGINWLAGPGQWWNSIVKSFGFGN